jgi:(+)-trans-carveol dehydrogenase
MTGRVEGKVAFVTGAARGQGRSHAIRLAEEGADIIAVDVCDQAAELAETGGSGGSIVITSSTAGLKGFQNMAHYSSAKHGVVGLMRTLALELAPHSIRVNTVHLTSVNTDMIQNEATFRLFLPGLEHPTPEQFAEVPKATNALPVPWVEPADISSAVLFLASDEARYVTGVTFPVDAGFTVK